MDELIKAVEGLKVIRDYCLSCYDCKRCLFSKSGVCFLITHPCGWSFENIEKQITDKEANND